MVLIVIVGHFGSELGAETSSSVLQLPFSILEHVRNFARQGNVDSNIEPVGQIDLSHIPDGSKIGRAIDKVVKEFATEIGVARAEDKDLLPSKSTLPVFGCPSHLAPSSSSHPQSPTVTYRQRSAIH